MTAPDNRSQPPDIGSEQAGRLSIAFLGPFGLGPKGTMRARALPAARALARAGHSVHVVMPPWHTPAEAGRVWSEDGVALTYVGLGPLAVPAAGHLAVASSMLGAALRAKPDVVHVFKPKAYGALAGFLYRIRQRLGRRGLLVVDTDDWEGPGGWNELEPYSAAERAFFRWQEAWELTHAQRTTVASRALETLAWALGVRRDRVLYLPNGVEAVADEPGPSEASAGRGPGPVILLYTRFFEFELGRPLAVLERVRRQAPGARLLLAGRGLYGEEDAFLGKARERGLGSAVDYWGWVEDGQAGDLFRQAHIAIYPMSDSLVARTKSPVKLLELMAAGLPVVGESVGEVGQVIEPGSSGLLVGPGDVDAMAGAILELWADPGRAAAIGAAARARIRSHYNWEALARGLVAFYTAGLAARGITPRAALASSLTSA